MISNYLENLLLGAVFNGETITISGVYLSVHTSDPGRTGGGEAVGGEYSRQPATFSIAFGGSVTNTDDVTFLHLPSGEYNWSGVWDAVSSGHFLWGSTFLEPKLIGADDGLMLYSGGISYTLS